MFCFYDEIMCHAGHFELFGCFPCTVVCLPPPIIEVGWVHEGGVWRGVEGGGGLAVAVGVC